MGSFSSQPTPTPTGGGDSFGPSQLAGTGSPSGAPGGDPNQQPDMSGLPGNGMDSQSNALATVVDQVRGWEQGLLSLAQQFPAAAPEVRRAADAIRAVLQRIVSSPSESEPPSPRSLA